jgi:hypothetical protein
MSFTCHVMMGTEILTLITSNKYKGVKLTKELKEYKLQNYKCLHIKTKTLLRINKTVCRYGE